MQQNFDKELLILKSQLSDYKRPGNGTILSIACQIFNDNIAAARDFLLTAEGGILTIREFNQALNRKKYLKIYYLEEKNAAC